MTEKSALNQTGVLIYSPLEKKYYFRVYQEDKTFTDYNLCAEDIKITITDKHLTLYQNGEESKLDYSRKTLGKSLDLSFGE